MHPIRPLVFTTLCVSCLVVVLIACSGSGGNCGSPSGYSNIITECMGNTLVTCVNATGDDYQETDTPCRMGCGPIAGYTPPSGLKLVSEPNGCLQACTVDANCAGNRACVNGACSGYLPDFAFCSVGLEGRCKPDSTCLPITGASVAGDAGTDGGGQSDAGDSGRGGCCWPATQAGPVRC
jgi:hypothetical protein